MIRILTGPQTIFSCALNVQFKASFLISRFKQIRQIPLLIFGLFISQHLAAQHPSPSYDIIFTDIDNQQYDVFRFSRRSILYHFKITDIPFKLEARNCHKFLPLKVLGYKSQILNFAKQNTSSLIVCQLKFSFYST